MSRAGFAVGATIGLAVLALQGCADRPDDDPGTAPWARGTATIEGRTYEVAGISMGLELGEDGFYFIDGAPVADAGEDCVPGLAGGLSFYGPLPRGTSRPGDLVGERVRLEFSGDGDDANLCFRGIDGLLGAVDAWVEFGPVANDRVAFSMSGRFRFYGSDAAGPPRPVTASARGVAQVVTVRDGD